MSYRLILLQALLASVLVAPAGLFDRLHVEYLQPLGVVQESIARRCKIPMFERSKSHERTHSSLGLAGS